VEVSSKLQLKPGPSVAVLNPPPGLIVPGVVAAVTAADADAVVALVVRQDDLGSAEQAVAAARADRLAWIGDPEGGRLGTDLNRGRLAAALAGQGVQPVRQVSIDGTWSALRFRPAKQEHTLAIAVPGPVTRQQSSPRRAEGRDASGGHTGRSSAAGGVRPARGLSALAPDRSRRAGQRAFGPGTIICMALACLVQHGEKQPVPGDPGLTPAGRRQASRTGRWLRGRGVQAFLAGLPGTLGPVAVVTHGGITTDLLRNLLHDDACRRSCPARASRRAPSPRSTT
jgi:hypothetical protein